MTDALLPKVQPSLAVRGTGTSGAAPADDRGNALAWHRAFDQARTTAGGADASDVRRPLRPLAQPFANPPRWAPGGDGASDSPATQGDGQAAVRHHGRGHGVQAGAVDGAARATASRVAASTVPAFSVQGDAGSRLVATARPPLPMEQGAAGISPAALEPSSGGREAAMSLPLLFNATARRRFLSFVSFDSLRDLPDGLAWHEAHEQAAAPPASSDAGAEPMRLHAEWTELGVKLWIGADRSVDGTALLPLLQRWVAARGERLLLLVCNGRGEFQADNAEASSAVPSSLADDRHRVALPQESPWQPAP